MCVTVIEVLTISVEKRAAKERLNTCVWEMSRGGNQRARESETAAEGWVIERHYFVVDYRGRRVHDLVAVDRDAVADVAVESVVQLHFAYRRERVDTRFAS